MQIEKICKNGVNIAVINSPEQLICDTQSALDLMMSVKYEADTQRVVIAKHNITEDFFILSTGLAGEILQKFVNFGRSAAPGISFAHYLKVCGV